jgi:hypothetical protein
VTVARAGDLSVLDSPTMAAHVTGGSVQFLLRATRRELPIAPVMTARAGRAKNAGSAPTASAAAVTKPCHGSGNNAIGNGFQSGTGT